MADVDDDYVLGFVRRAAPKVNRPRLPSEYESLFQPHDQARAECYVAMERMTERLDAIADALNSEDDEYVESGVVVGINEGDSLVHHIEIALASGR